MKKNVIVKTQKGEKEKEKSLNGKGKEEKKRKTTFVCLQMCGKDRRTK